MDNEELQLTAIAVASVSIVAALTFIASWPIAESNQIAASSRVSNSEAGLDRSKLRKDAADQGGNHFVVNQVPPETKQEPDQQGPARKGGSFPSVTPPVFPDEKFTSEKSEHLSTPNSERVYRPTKAVLSVSRKAPAHRKAATRNEVPYGSLPNRKGESSLPTELQTNPLSEFLEGL